MTYPARLQTLIDDLTFLDDWEDRYRYLIDLGKALPAMAPGEQTEATRVQGCASQVWLVIEPQPNGRLHLRGDSDALIVKGLVALVLTMYDDQTPADILAFDAHAVLAKIGLSTHLTAQRANGLAAMVKRIRAVAAP